ncbi:MAG: glycosyltransferase family 4 protein [Ignavibacteriaceae bacterium]|nr:glycosyltransferase family 4 protein [Ignavibacteriaceae bacterium]
MLNKKILFLFPRTPLNYNTSNDKRQYLIYSTLNKKFETKILTFGEKDEVTGEQITVRLKNSNFKKIFYFISRLKSSRLTHYQSEKFKYQLQKILASYEPDIIYIEHLLLMQYILKLETNAKIVFYNDESNWFVDENNLRGNLYQSLRNIGLTSLERIASLKACLILTISNEEAEFLRAKGIKNVETISYGIDTDYFKFDWRKPEDKTILFIGDYSHYPNRQAAKILVTKVLPALNNLGVRLKLVGRNTNRIKNLVRDNVEIYNNVPDVRPFYYNSSVFAAPIFSGAGMRVKILEAALCGIPLIISPAANLGINFFDRDQVFICKSTDEFVKVMGVFFRSMDRYTIDSMIQNARKKIASEFDEKKVKEKIGYVFERAELS